ncbi:hypothetical protein [Burkholderia ubonensis]|uniref:hypothetical protein n=1 Tax=Burkholderia ubonensis TaxID=101571 RepID=UPI00076C272F|nr:hypothetical protein [Burkholderia ubonensis]KVP17169.1 hypothetical protein WJ84_02500 [Burkholderia ubonensis]
MPQVATLHLIRANMAQPVRHNVRLDGAPSGQPGVTAVVARSGGLGWCVLADHPRNPGVSVTNGAEQYAAAVCRALECDIVDLAWYELDSEGNFDELHLQGASVGYAPLLEDGCRPRSLDAFSARVARLPAGLPEDAALVIQSCLKQFQA